MRRLILGVMWVAASCTAVRHEPTAEPTRSTEVAAKASEAFFGTWEIVIVQPDGATKDARQLVFNEDGTYSAQDEGGKELWVGTFEIDPAASPRVWDHRSLDAMKERRDVLGIYDLDGDNLKVACVVGQWKANEWVGRSRPKGFDLKQADVVIEFKRVKPNESN